jgi:hypothetical protein
MTNELTNPKATFLSSFMNVWGAIVIKCYSLNLIKYFLMISVADVITTTWGFYLGHADMSYFVSGLRDYAHNLIAFFILFLIIKLIIVYIFYYLWRKPWVNVNDFLKRIMTFDILMILVCLQTFVVVHNLIILSGGLIW